LKSSSVFIAHSAPFWDVFPQSFHSSREGFGLFGLFFTVFKIRPFCGSSFSPIGFFALFWQKAKNPAKSPKITEKQPKTKKNAKNPGKRNAKAGKIPQIADKRRNFDNRSLQNRAKFVFLRVNLKRSVDVKIEKSESAVSQTKNSLIQERMKKQNENGEKIGEKNPQKNGKEKRVRRICRALLG